MWDAIDVLVLRRGWNAIDVLVLKTVVVLLVSLIVEFVQVLFYQFTYLLTCLLTQASAGWMRLSWLSAAAVYSYVQ